MEDAQTADEALRTELAVLLVHADPEVVAENLSERGYFVTVVGLGIHRPVNQLLSIFFASVGAETYHVISLRPEHDRFLKRWIIRDLPIEGFTKDGMDPEGIFFMPNTCVVAPDLSAGIFNVNPDVGLLFLRKSHAQLPKGVTYERIIRLSEGSLVNAWPGKSFYAKRFQRGMRQLFWAVRGRVDG